MRRSIQLLIDGTLIVLIGVVAGGVVLGRVLPATGRAAIIVTGPSMEPAIPRGAVVVTSPADPARLAAGDTVTYQVDSRRAVVTHRITRLVTRADGSWIETKGDGNSDADPVLVPAAAVLGRVELVLPHAGSLMAILRQPAGVAIVLGLAGLLLAAQALLAPGTTALQGEVRAAGSAS